MQNNTCDCGVYVLAYIEHFFNVGPQPVSLARSHVRADHSLSTPRPPSPLSLPWQLRAAEIGVRVEKGKKNTQAHWFDGPEYIIKLRQRLRE